MHHVKLTRVGGGLGLTLPPETLAKLGLKEGDSLVLNETDAGFTLGRPTAAQEQTRKALDRTMETFDPAFRELAP